MSSSSSKKSKATKVLITAPSDYALRFAAAMDLATRGLLEPVVAPLIQTVANERVKDFIAVNRQYDFVVFTSRKAIVVLADYLGTDKLSDSAAYCAIGKDNDSLPLVGVKPAFIAEEPSLMGIGRHICSAEVVGKRVAVLGPEVVGLAEPDTVPNFLRFLAEAGLIVDFYPAYTTSPVTPSKFSNASCLLHEVSWVAFTSATEAQVFKRLVNPSQLKKSGVRLACFGPYTAQCVRQEGFDIDFVFPDFSSFSAYARELCLHIQ